MIQLRYLQTVTLYKATQTKQENGVLLETDVKVDDYLVFARDINDEVSASIYGAKINNMLRLCSPRKTLEAYLLTKLNHSSDNISKYRIVFNGNRYKIVSVKDNWVDIEL